MHNPPITSLLRWVTALECVVLIISGLGLFLFPDVIRPLWPWVLTPFNTRFLGAVYLGSLSSALLLVFYGRWIPARVVVPMIFTFTLIVLVVSLINLNNFIVPTSTGFWLLLYIAIPMNAAYHLWLYRDLPPAQPITLPHVLRTYLVVQAVVLGLYGVGLLILPSTFAAFWPWPLDDFHARLYSVSAITPAVGAWILARSASKNDVLTLGITQVVAGFLSVIGLLIVNAIVPAERQVNWSLAGTWLWIAFSLMIFLGGLAMLSILRAPVRLIDK
jgi:hypothetical protein